MDDLGTARALLSQQKYREAADILDRMLLSDGESDELWYLRGMVSLKMKNYDAAQECFERALVLGRKSRYYQIKGMAHFELFEMEEAAGAFRDALALEDGPTSNFFLAMCYMFLDDPRSDEHMRRAYQLDKRKSSQLLLNFYTIFLKDDPRVPPQVRKRIEDRIKSLRG
jgi:tetratricopeptide (TPR) repeat protein